MLDVVVFEMDAGTSFDAHVHAEHQLAWASEGVLTVDCGNETWVLPPTRALWIPAGVRHETRSSGPAIMRTAYINSDRSPLAFARPTPIGAGQLLAELITYLADARSSAEARAHAEMVLFDVLTPVSNSAIELRMPSDERALDVARAIIGDPADGRDLDDWGHFVGASARTLARLCGDGSHLRAVAHARPASSSGSRACCGGSGERGGDARRLHDDERLHRRLPTRDRVYPSALLRQLNMSGAVRVSRDLKAKVAREGGATTERTVTAPFAARS